MGKWSHRAFKVVGDVRFWACLHISETMSTRLDHLQFAIQKFAARDRGDTTIANSDLLAGTPSYYLAKKSKTKVRHRFYITGQTAIAGRCGQLNLHDGVGTYPSRTIHHTTK